MKYLLFQSQHSLSTKVLNVGKCREFLMLNILVLFIRLPKSFFQILCYYFTNILNIPTNDSEMHAVKFPRICG